MSTLFSLDQTILEYVLELRNPVLTALSLFVSGMAEFAAVWIVLVAILIHYDRPRGWMVAQLSTIAFGIQFAVVSGVFGWLVYRPRPYLALPDLNQMGLAWTNNSFPSGHVASTVAVLWVVSAVYPRVRPWAVGIGLLMMLSRVYNGMHWPTDVVVGALVGIFAGWLTLRLLPAWQKLVARQKVRRA